MSASVTISPIDSVHGTVVAPPSKPETQRAVLLASLAAGRSNVSNVLTSHETDAMVEACRNLGATLDFCDDDKEVTVGGCGFQAGFRLASGHRHFWASGSGLVARIFTVLGSSIEQPVLVDGNTVLRGRVFAPLARALTDGGVALRFLDRPDQLPVRCDSVSLPGGEYSLPGDQSSQFATALLLGAPFADRTTRILQTRPVYSAAYLAQTIAALRAFGVSVDHSDDYAEIVVEPASLRPTDIACGGDFTSASYLVAAAAILPSNLVIHGLDRSSLQGERLILDTVEALGASVDWTGDVVTVSNRTGRLSGHHVVDVMVGPNIVPTLAAIGAFVEDSLTVRGGALTRLHKSDRLTAMIGELGRLGVDIEPVDTDGVPDGFIVRGRESYDGGVDLQDHGDHRNFMSLLVASLRCRRPNRIHGHLDVAQSYPEFLDQIQCLGHPAFLYE